MRSTVLIIFLIHSFLFTSAQSDYTHYHKLVNNAEIEFTNENFSEAVSLYQSVFEQYDYVFLKDLIIAAQIAVLNSDNALAFKWMERAIKDGYDCNCFKKIEVFNELINSTEWLAIEAKSDNYNSEYRKSINKKYYHNFHYRYKKEQENKSNQKKHKYIDIVKDNFYNIKSFIESQNFPSERIIGIDNENIYPTTSGGKLHNCDAANSKVIPTLLHYDNPITDIGFPKFIHAIKTGHLHPRQFATVYSFETNYISRLSENKHHNKPNLPEYHFNFTFDKKHLDLERVNADRYKLGICSIELDSLKKNFAEKYGLKLNFGYK